MNLWFHQIKCSKDWSWHSRKMTLSAKKDRKIILLLLFWEKLKMISGSLTVQTPDFILFFCKKSYLTKLCLMQHLLCMKCHMHLYRPERYESICSGLAVKNPRTAGICWSHAVERPDSDSLISVVACIQRLCVPSTWCCRIWGIWGGGNYVLLGFGLHWGWVAVGKQKTNKTKPCGSSKSQSHTLWLKLENPSVVCLTAKQMWVKPD